MASSYTNNTHIQWQSSDVAPLHQRRPRRVQSRQAKQLSTPELYLRLMVMAAIVFGIVQSVRTLTLGSYNIAALLKNQSTVHQALNSAREENQILSEKIDLYSSPAGIEDLARNSLHMVGQNEILVRIH